jgi:hypothetical protein
MPEYARVCSMSRADDRRILECSREHSGHLAAAANCRCRRRCCCRRRRLLQLDTVALAVIRTCWIHLPYRCIWAVRRLLRYSPYVPSASGTRLKCHGSTGRFTVPVPRAGESRGHRANGRRIIRFHVHACTTAYAAYTRWIGSGSARWPLKLMRVRAVRF